MILKSFNPSTGSGHSPSPPGNAGLGVNKTSQEDLLPCDNIQAILEAIFARLFEHFGPQHWWPAETAFEVVVGAILTQNTSWTNVERAIKALKRADMLSIDGIYHCNEDKLSELIKPSGFFRRKAKRLKHFVDYIVNQWNGSLEAFLSQPMEALRSQLLELNGIGPETADSIILYAAGQPSFVVDRYTHRVMFRHGYVPEQYCYEELKQLFMNNLPHDIGLFQEYHALFVRLGKEYCTSKPRCQGCPLNNGHSFIRKEQA